MSRSDRTKDALVLFASVLAHVALSVLLVRGARFPPREPRSVDATPSAEIELALEPLPSPALPQEKSVAEVQSERAKPAAASAAPSNPHPRAATLLGEFSSESGGALVPKGSAEKQAAAAEQSPGVVSTARPLSLAELGVGRNPFLPGRGSAPTQVGAGGESPAEPSAKERVEASLRSDARAREAELGLGPDGPVRAALMDAMYASDAPVIARVVFSVRADANGKLLSIEAVSADRGLSAFQGMARLAREKLARTTLRLPSSAKGANLRVEVTSAWKLPSGHDPGLAVDLFGQSLTKGEGKTATKVTLLPMPKVACISPDDPKNDLKLPLCGIVAPLFATDGDPADIGAKPRRIVSTKVVESTVL